MVKNKREITPKKRGALTITKPLAKPTNSVNRGVPAANIKVVVRVRPLNEKEQGDNSRNVIRIIDNQMLIFDPKEESQPFFYQGVQQKGRDLLKKSNKHLQFMFDKVFEPGLANNEVFLNSTHTLIDSLMDGYNCSVFAYGATGAGKTFTMIGNSEMPGITCLTMAELFKRKEELSAEREFELAITYLEVYNENVRDLLNPGPALHLREDARYGVTVAGIKLHRIENSEELFTLLETGNKNRTQHPTDANAESSRSHAVFQVYIHMTTRCTREMRTAKLSMIDLAGSERASATGCTGARFAEGANINKSLLALGNCINSLADGHRHIPYRDSKLTRLLKDSLGGNCQTVMIANVSPSSLTYEDTYNTLKYATRAKKIKSTIKRNVVNVEMHVGQYVKIVEEQKAEIMMLKKQLAEKSAVAVGPTEQDIPLLSQLIELFRQKRSIVDRTHHIESLNQGMSLRKQMKEDADARVSDHCTDTPEKVEAHRKLGNILTRFQNKSDALKEELIHLQREKLALDCKINDMLTQNPNLKQAAEIENIKISERESNYKYELSEKKLEIMEDKMKSQQELFDKLSSFIKPVYLSMKGHGLATEEMTRDYQMLSKCMEGVKSIKWGETVFDSGVSSSSTSTLSVLEVDSSSSTRLDNDKEEDLLNDTFTLNSKSSKTCAEKVMAKVYESPAAKRLARKLVLKENKVPRRPLSRVRTDSTKVIKPRSASNRPPFR